MTEMFRDWAEEVMKIAIRYPHLSYDRLVANNLIVSWMEYALSVKLRR